ncbi:MAG: hypothetical protein ACK4S0_08455 [Sediminibacterium sp.]|nr:hypothetical protein [uncultured Sediminibacterium sp.]
MKQRRQIGIFTIVIIGVGLGLLIKNVRIGLLIGLALGLFAGSLIRNR